MTPELAAWISIAGCVFTLIGVIAWLKNKLTELAKVPETVISLDQKIQKHEIWLKILFDEAGKIPPEPQ